MLTLRDCLDYCDLTDDDVEMVAEHEHMPPTVAAHFACAMVQTSEGVLEIAHFMEEIVEDAEVHGELNKAEHVRHVCARFQAAHPLAH